MIYLTPIQNQSMYYQFLYQRYLEAVSQFTPNFMCLALTECRGILCYSYGCLLLKLCFNLIKLNPDQNIIVKRIIVVSSLFKTYSTFNYLLNIHSLWDNATLKQLRRSIIQVPYDDTHFLIHFKECIMTAPFMTVQCTTCVHYDNSLNEFPNLVLQAIFGWIVKLSRCYLGHTPARCLDLSVVSWAIFNKAAQGVKKAICTKLYALEHRIYQQF
jgi:hypothetical protein